MVILLQMQIRSPCLLLSIDSSMIQPRPKVLRLSNQSSSLNVLLSLPYYGLIRVCISDSVKEYLPAIPKGRPKKNAVLNLVMTRIRREFWRTTHGAPVSHGEESCEGIEWNVAARTFGVVASKP